MTSKDPPSKVRREAARFAKVREERDLLLATLKSMEGARSRGLDLPWGLVWNALDTLRTPTK